MNPSFRQTLLVMLGLLWSVKNYAQSETYQFFRLNTTLDFQTIVELKNGASLSDASLYDMTDPNILQNMLDDPSSFINFSLPIDSENSLTIELLENKVLSSDFKIRNSKNEQISLSEIRTFSGSIKNKEGSKVVLTLTKDNLKGIIHFDGDSYIFGKTTNHPQFIFYKGSDMQTPNIPLSESDELNIPEEVKKAQIKSNLKTQTNGCKVLRIYFEIDYSLYNTWGSNNTSVTNNFIALMNTVVSTYAIEQIEVEVGGLRIWDALDPYHNATLSISESLESFRVAVNAISPAYDGNMAHLLSTELFGGLAYVGILDFQPYAVGVTGFIDNYTTNSPHYGWNAEAICHEIGHNIASPHTQNCSWPGGPIDNCVPPEGTCPSGTPSPPPPINGGTIMSYCQYINTPYTTLLANGFGPLPGAKIREGIANAASLQTSAPPSNAVITGNEPVCFPGSAAISANCNTGVAKWYEDAAGTILLHSGTTYNTSTLNSNTTVYVACERNDCQSSLTSVNITGTATPTPPPSKTSYFCSDAQYTLTADGCAGGIVCWYSSTMIRNPTFVGNPLTVQNSPPGSLASKDYYSSCKIGGCESSRTLQRAQKITDPTSPTVSNQTIQNGTSATLTSQNCNYTTRWYAELACTTLLQTGNTYTTPNLTVNTTYYLRCEADACLSTVSQALVTVNNCQNYFIFSSPTDNISSGIHHHESYNQIESTSKITGGDVKYDASTFVELNPGFTVSNGAVFKAYIDGCGGN